MEAIVLILGIVFGGWILSLILGIKLARARRALGEMATNPVSPVPTAVLPGAPLQDLLVLRLELKGLSHSDQLTHDRFVQLADEIDKRIASELAKAGIDRVGNTWSVRRDTGWRILVAHGGVTTASPPWVVASPAAILSAESLVASTVEPVSDGLPSQAQPPEPPVRKATPAGAGDATGSVQVSSPLAKAKPMLQTKPTVPKPKPATSTERPREHAWTPSPPSALEETLHRVAGWPRAMLPFLLQNVGWFVGVFCFLAGSIFLVSYTSGFTKALTVAGALFTYTGFLIWAGYRLRLRRPNIKTASYALMIMGMLLVPLNFSAAARLLFYAGDAWLLGAVGLLVTAVMVVVFGVAARVISGINDRALQNQHALLFMALAGAQLGLPLVARWPHWPLLALIHVALLTMLGFGLWRYANGWMQTIFVERRKTAYFAAGTLVYAAVISFVHLTWSAEELTLPPGYFAPYLMAVCGLLFYLDAQFKLNTRRSAFLSRFTFFVYGLSALSVALALDVPPARSATLFLAAFIYAVMVWKYLTLVPFYLLLASLGGLYAGMILTHFPPAWHFVASLPGLIGLFVIGRWVRALAAGRGGGGMSLALMSYYVLVGLLVTVGGWSLVHSQPGLLAMGGALVLAAALWWLFPHAPGSLRQLTAGASAEAFLRNGIDLRNSPWLYLVTAAVIAAVAFSTPLPGVHWSLQFSSGLVVLSGLWAGCLLGSLRSMNQPLVPLYEVLANSALLSLFGGVALAVSDPLGSTLSAGVLCLVFGTAAGVFLVLSLGLYVRWLFYGFLVAAGLSGALLKFTFFPGPSVGTVQMLIAIALWSLTWWLHRQPDQLVALREQRARREGLTLLWRFPTVSGVSSDCAPPDMVSDGLPNPAEASRRAVHNDEEANHV